MSASPNLKGARGDLSDDAIDDETTFGLQRPDNASVGVERHGIGEREGPVCGTTSSTAPSTGSLERVLCAETGFAKSTTLAMDVRRAQDSTDHDEGLMFRVAEDLRNYTM